MLGVPLVVETTFFKRWMIIMLSVSTVDDGVDGIQILEVETEVTLFASLYSFLGKFTSDL